jgi:hypothetical protein
MTFYYCDTLPPIQYIQVTNIHPPPPSKLDVFPLCSDVHLFFYLDCVRMSTFALKLNVDVLSHVTGAHLEVFWLVWQGGGGEMSKWSRSWPDGTH